MSSSPAILLDATAIPADRGGVGRYVEELARALVQIGANLVVCTQAEQASGFREAVPGATIVAAPAAIRRRPIRLLWEQIGLPRLIRRLNVDVLLSPHYTMPLLARRPVVVTIHDATFFSQPRAHGRLKRYFFSAWIRMSLRRAAECIVPTRAVADELVRYAGADAESLTVAHHGVDRTRFHPPDAAEIARTRAALELTGPWVAFLGTLEPRKNVPALIRAFAQVMESDRPRHTLVLAGGPGWDRDVQPTLDALPASVQVIRAGYLPIDLLPGLLGGSAVTVYPSLGEGFGLPVLEAMACGAAVLTTQRPPMPEVGGDAVAYCGVDQQSIEQALASLLDDSGQRARLSAAALRRADEFTWQASADTHLSALERAAAGHHA